MASPEFVQALDWSFKKIEGSNNYDVEFIAQSWSDLTKVEKADLLLCHFDIGQPVPITHLEKFESMGLAVFIQPTPKQLLEISGLKNWVAMDWEGAGYDRIAFKVLDLLESERNEYQQKVLLETLSDWLSHKQNQLKELVWLNARDKSTHKKYLIPKGQNFFSIGAAQSHADFKLPVEGRDEYIYFQNVNHRWSLRPAAENISYSFSGDVKDLKVGDFLRVFNFDFEFKTDNTTRELLNITQLKTNNVKELEKKGAQNFSDLLKTLLMRQYSGELRVKGPVHFGYVYIDEGKIIQAYCGAVLGVKALLRIQEWDESSWVFYPGKKDNSQFQKLFIAWAEFQSLYNKWHEKWTQLKHLVPPLNMRLAINPDVFAHTHIWSTTEYRVAAAVAEYSSVRDVLNYCEGPDHEIVEVLVQLRRKNLLIPMLR